MRPGPTQIKKCSSCEGLISKSTVASGNTFGAKFWTDGVMHAPMLPVTPQIAKCPHCKSIEVLEQLEVIGETAQPREFGFYLNNPEASAQEIDQLHGAERYEKASFEELINFLASMKLQPEVERIARIQAWRAGNDARRGSDTPYPQVEVEIKNLELLLPLLNKPHDYSALVKVEVLRNLGLLDEAKKFFKESIFDRREENSAQFILELIESGDTQVCEITPKGDREWRILRRKRARVKTEDETIEVDPTGPPVLDIKSRDWWVMVIGMFSHDWALIDDLEDGTSVAYFMEDSDGMSEFMNPKLKGRVAIMNSISFPNRIDAEQGLRLMGFEEKPGPWDGEQPDGIYYYMGSTFS
jgi:hypothetical protein